MWVLGIKPVVGVLTLLSHLQSYVVLLINYRLVGSVSVTGDSYEIPPSLQSIS